MDVFDIFKGPKHLNKSVLIFFKNSQMLKQLEKLVKYENPRGYVILQTYNFHIELWFASDFF